MTKITPGNIDEVRAASQERLELILLRKDFSGESFYRINLLNSTISKCVFTETKFFANTYEQCDFISCDFTKADFLNVNFKECKFHECKFDEATLQEVNFENCSIMSCSFANVKIENDVSGLKDEDMNVIHEEASLNEEDIVKMGFEKEGDDEFSIKSSVDNGPTVDFSIVKDSEMDGEVYRIMLMVNDESILSETFDIKEGIDYSEIKSIANSVLTLGGRKVTINFFNNDENQFKLYKEAFNEIKNKINL